MKKKKARVFGKKGSILDLILIMVVVLTVAIVSILGYHILNQFDAQTEDFFAEGSNVSSHAITKGKQAILGLDKVMIFIMVALTIAVVLGAFMLQTNPAFFIISIILLIITLVISAQITNIFEEIISTPQLENASSGFPVTQHLMANYPFYLLILGAIIIIALYARGRIGGQVV
jgi:hypothetical protein